MHPKIWGRSAWYFLHSVTLEYPNKPTKQDKNKMISFFMSMKDVLPCVECRDNFNKHLAQYPLTQQVLSSRHSLALWLVHIHNQVNKETGVNLMTLQQMLSTFGMKLSDL